MPADLLRPPFTRATAIHKIRRAEDSWNSRDPGKVALSRIARFAAR
jgi:nuclear transport factor 2 (NTF2) superfamily protein